MSKANKNVEKIANRNEKIANLIACLEAVEAKQLDRLPELSARLNEAADLREHARQRVAGADATWTDFLVGDSSAARAKLAELRSFNNAGRTGVDCHDPLLQLLHDVRELAIISKMHADLMLLLQGDKLQRVRRRVLEKRAARATCRFETADKQLQDYERALCRVSPATLPITADQ